MSLRAYGWAFALTAAAAVAGCDRAPADAPIVDRGEAPPPAASEPGADKNDALITTTIQSKYFASAEVKGHEIDVTTREGVVTLRGNVDTEEARKEAVAVARDTDGVSRVDDQLTVGAARRASDDRPSPGWITTKLQAQYFVNPEINPFEIDVTTTSDGVVTLDGTVDSADDRAAAVRIARQIEGVTDVRDNLRVQGETAATTGTLEPGVDSRAAGANQTFTDGWITAKVQSKYFLDPDVKAREIEVDTSGGAVTLRGTVASYGERQQAVAMARNTDGVREVRDELKVDSRVDAADDQGSARRSAEGTAATVGQTIDDAWITTRVQSKYFIDDQVRGHEIDVDTANGVVTLNGSVPSDEARRTAEELAKDTDGVSRVVNRLRVNPAQS